MPLLVILHATGTPWYILLLIAVAGASVGVLGTFLVIRRQGRPKVIIDRRPRRIPMRVGNTLTYWDIFYRLKSMGNANFIDGRIYHVNDDTGELYDHYFRIEPISLSPTNSAVPAKIEEDYIDLFNVGRRLIGIQSKSGSGRIAYTENFPLYMKLRRFKIAQILEDEWYGRGSTVGFLVPLFLDFLFVVSLFVLLYFALDI